MPATLNRGPRFGNANWAAVSAVAMVDSWSTAWPNAAVCPPPVAACVLWAAVGSTAKPCDTCGGSCLAVSVMSVECAPHNIKAGCRWHRAVRDGDVDTVAFLMRRHAVKQTTLQASIVALLGRTADSAGKSRRLLDCLFACLRDIPRRNLRFSANDVLHMAALNGHYKALHTLLERDIGTDIAAPGETVLHLVRHGEAVGARAMLARWPEAERFVRDAAFDAACNDKAASLAVILDTAQLSQAQLRSSCAKIVSQAPLQTFSVTTWPTPLGNTLLMEATAHDAFDVVTLLLQREGCPLHAALDNGSTALHLAASRQTRRCGEALIAAGCDVNAVNKHGERPCDVWPALGHGAEPAGG